MFSKEQDLSSHRIPYAHTLRLVRALGNWCERPLKLGVKHRLEIRIQHYENVVSCDGGRGVLGSRSKNPAKANQIRLVSTINRIDSVIDCSMHNGEATGWVNGCWLRARRPHNDEKYSVPLDNRVQRLSRSTRCFRALLGG